jgi:hypothetical protein
MASDSPHERAPALSGFRRRPMAGSDSLETPVRSGIHHHAQGAMVVVAERDEAEGLQGSVGSRAHRSKHFGHASYRTRLSLKSDLDKISLTQRLSQAQKPAGHGNGLKFGFGALTIFQNNLGQNGTTKLNTWRAALRMHLGEVSHGNNYFTALLARAGYQRHMYPFPG